MNNNLDFKKSLPSAKEICTPDTDPGNKELMRLMRKVNSDRGPLLHKYHIPYTLKFEPIKLKVRNMLELGIWTGKGLITWAQFFPNAEIEGVDWRFQYHNHIKRLFKNRDTDYYSNKIVLNFFDTTDTERVQQHFKPERYNEYFDIIIDDGNHFSSAQKATLINMFQYVKPGGMWVIEDITDTYERPEKILQHINDLADEGHTVEYFQNFESTRDDSNIIFITKKLTTAPSSNWILGVKYSENA
jgi:hypothetical protein